MYDYLFKNFNTEFKKFQEPILDLGIYRALLGAFHDQSIDCLLILDAVSVIKDINE